MGHYRPIEDRFWEKVAIDPYGGCWEWCGARTSDGYGSIGVSKEQGNAYAHRLSWELHNGPIPDGLCVLHKCDHRPCVNPEHLFIGDRAANAADMAAKGRSTRGEKNPQAKLTDESVREARILATAGVFQKDIAKKMGVSRQAIGNALSDKTWRHVV